MVSKIDILEPFNRIQPGPFISQYSDWIIFTLLLFLFWAVAGISLRKRFEESRYLRVLVTASCLIVIRRHLLFDIQWVASSKFTGLRIFRRNLIIYHHFFYRLWPNERLRHARIKCTISRIRSVLHKLVGGQP